MKKLLTNILLIMAVSYCQGQLFYFSVPNIQFIAEPGAGIDSRLYLGFTQTAHGKAIISAQAPTGVTVIFQPDTLTESDTIIMSVMITDTNLIDDTIPVVIKASDSTGEITHNIFVQVVNVWGHLTNYPAYIYRDQAINYLKHEHPGIVTQYGDMLDFDWQGFWPYPPLLGVSNYVFLTNEWRCNVLWYVMPHPYDWKKIFIYNIAKNVCWGVKIDTAGNFTEIPCQQHYYFVQDSNALSNHSAVSDSKNIKNFPNPCTSYTTIEFPNPDHTSQTLRIYNSCGQLVKEVLHIRDNKVILENLQWNSGVYYYNIQNENGILGYGRIIKVNN
jgi:hypothetical protein